VAACQGTVLRPSAIFGGKSWIARKPDEGELCRWARNTPQSRGCNAGCGGRSALAPLQETEGYGLNADAAVGCPAG
jgi:hypothetical protein